MRIVFMGTPDLAAGILSALYQAGYEIPLVVTQPDRSSGRGQRQGDSPVKALAADLGLAVYQPDSVREHEAIQRIRGVQPDAIVVAAYGKILPAELLDAAPFGCLNVHASLLPAYRGAAPIQWALLNGDEVTGITIMKLDEGMDTGAMLSQEELPISEDMDYGDLYKALTGLGARLLLEALPLWAKGSLKPRPQPVEGVSYAPKLGREDEIIDWGKPAVAICSQIRAFGPAPGASTRFGGKEIKCIRARAASDEEVKAAGGDAYKLQPGQIIGILRRQGPIVAAGKGCLVLTQIQPVGKKAMDGWAWLNGSRAKPGQFFE